MSLGNTRKYYRPLDVNEVIGLILHTRIKQWLRGLLHLLKEAPILLVVVILFLGGYAILGFDLSFRAVRFVSSFPGLGPLLIERMMYILFAFLFGLLLISSTLIAYGSLFKNDETKFLAVLPIVPEAIITWKFVESAILASWAFIFLISPMVCAYGAYTRVSWNYYPVALLFVALFIVLPGSLGMGLSLFLARYLDRRVFQLFFLTFIGIVLVTLIFCWKPVVVQEGQLEDRVISVIDRLLMRTKFVLFPYLPSYWLASGLIRWSEGAIQNAIFFCGVLLSYALLFGYITSTVYGALFYESLSAVNSRASTLKELLFRQISNGVNFKYRIESIIKLINRLNILRPDVTAIILKDLKLFWRDTTQWAQSIVIFALLAVYFINLRHFSTTAASAFWISIISFLNLGACVLNLATLTSRFGFPQFSLEIKRLWIIGLTPLSLRKIMWTKLLAMLTLSGTLTVVLIVLSCLTLKLSQEQILYQLGAALLICWVLNSLAISLGILYPEVREDVPAKIVSGFGGTLCLTASFLYIVISVLLLGLVAPWSFKPLPQPYAMIGGWVIFLFISVLLGIVPLRAAFRRLEDYEIVVYH